MNLAVRRVHIREQMNDAPNMQLEHWGAPQPSYWLLGCAVEFLI